jgi:transposase
MKFKVYQQKKDFITGETIVGIDPAKQHHQAAVVNPFGIQIGKSFSFPVTIDGFNNALWKKLNSIISQYTTDNLVFAVESSCNLWKTIAYYLHEKDYTVLLVNPLTTHHSRPLMNHDFSKTDPKDAFLIAKNAFDANYDFYQSLSPQINSLHQLSITYDKLLKDKNKNLLRMRSLMEEVFPEFLDCLNIDTKTALFLLESSFLPHHFINLDIEKLAPVITSISHSNYNKQLLLNLKDAASKTIGVNKISEEQSLRIILNSWLLEFKQINNQTAILMAEMIALAKQTDHFKILTSIKGISDNLASRFIAECRELNNFQHYKQIEKLAGLNLRLSQSGDYVGPRHISHIGDRRLLHIIYQMTAETAMYIPEVRIKFLTRQIKNKAYRKNIIASSSELLQLIMALIKKKKTYEFKENKIQQLALLEQKYKKAA